MELLNVRRIGSEEWMGIVNVENDEEGRCGNEESELVEQTEAKTVSEMKKR